MRALINNLDREKVVMILEWCKKNFGKSKYYDDFPSLRVCRSTGSSYYPKGDKQLFGTHRYGLITIYLGTHTSMKDLCKTVIHEYKHNLLSDEKYESIMNRLEKKGYSDDDIYEKHPHEKKCKEFENKWGDICFNELRRKLYKK